MVSVINTIYQKTEDKDKPQLENPSHADISKAMLLNRFVFVLYLKILPDIEIENYDNFDETDEKTINDKWYNNISLVGKMRCSLV